MPEQKTMVKKIVVGADLGTGSIVLCSGDSLDTKPIIITHGGTGEISMPSTIKIKGDNIFEIGVKERTTNVIRQTKRFFGAKYKKVSKFTYTYPYDIVRRADDGCEFQIVVQKKDAKKEIKITPFEVTVKMIIYIMNMVKSKYSQDYEISFAFSFPARFTSTQVNLFRYASMYYVFICLTFYVNYL